MTECKYGDPMCPCQDGDACHYEAYPGSPAVPCVPTEYVRRALDRHRVTDEEVSILAAVRRKYQGDPNIETLFTILDRVAGQP